MWSTMSDAAENFGKSRTGKSLGVVADVMGESKESNFITVVGNREIHLVKRVKERWTRGS